MKPSFSAAHEISFQLGIWFIVSLKELWFVNSLSFTLKATCGWGSLCVLGKNTARIWLITVKIQIHLQKWIRKDLISWNACYIQSVYILICNEFYKQRFHFVWNGCIIYWWLHSSAGSVFLVAEIISGLWPWFSRLFLFAVMNWTNYVFLFNGAWNFFKDHYWGPNNLSRSYNL